MAKKAMLTLGCAGYPCVYLRDCSQELFPLLTGELRRTVNGALVYAGSPLHHKYRSTITARDKISFSVDMLWRGNVVEVGCIQRIKEKIKGSSFVLSRTPLSASTSVKTLDGQKVAIRRLNQRTLELEHAIAEGFASYRPLLTMRIVNFHLQAKDEDITPAWQLWLEEI